MTAIVIDNITIRQDEEGRFNLNDLHKAAGGERRYDTREFFRRDSTQRLAAELEGKMTQKPVNFQRGRYGGTFVCKELVYEYAMWISPEFKLKVIKAYDRLATQGIAVHESAGQALLADPLKFLEIALAQAKELQTRVDIAEPKAEAFDRVVADKRMTVADFARTLHGANMKDMKSCLLKKGYFYRDHDLKYRVYAQYRDKLFAEKVNAQYGNCDIFVLDEGKQLLTQLYKRGELPMKKGFKPV